jgi:hypothetical protein
MKKVLVFALCVVGFILIAAPTAVEYSPLFINGKPAGQAVLINGIIAISMEHALKAGGATMTMQPNFERQGPRLLALLGSDMKKAQPVAKEKWTPPPANGAGVPAVQAGMLKQNEPGTVKLSPAPGQIFRVQRAGEISSHVFDYQGKAYLPLADLARALGNNTWTGRLEAGKPLQMNFSSNPNAILIGL